MNLYYAHDPMCSWCWAFHQAYHQLAKILPSEIKLTRLLGGLAPDNDNPMPDETRNYIIGQWRSIQIEIPATQFNYDFWDHCQPRRSTYPACRAVIAARIQNTDYDELMTYAIQKAYYLQAKNPSDTHLLIELAGEIGCDKNQFETDLHASQTNQILHDEINLARQLSLNSFPGLLVTNNSGHYHIAPDYHDAQSMLRKILDFY